MVRMFRSAKILMLGITITMAVLAGVAAVALDRKLVDPDGFLGPAWLRGPMLVFGALLLDMLPRILAAIPRGVPGMKSAVVTRWRAHWTRERLTLTVMGVLCFYLTYVCYRNLKNFLPDIMGLDRMYDRQLHLIDKWLFFGREPAVIMHSWFDQDFVVHGLSSIYLWFLPLVPLGLTVWLIWSRKLAYGYWFVTAQCLAWTLGTASYYLLPTLGPGFEYPWLYEGLPTTAAESLMDALFYSRSTVLYEDPSSSLSSVAGFASLHIAITLLFAMMAQYTLRVRWIKVVFWVNFALTIVATLYFGWHYVLDDVGGVAIAMLSVYIGAKVSGVKLRYFRMVEDDDEDEEVGTPQAAANRTD